ncbi:M48 family metallopeptidase [Pseudoalteromonas shioyasakiensis]|uniref:M48 family metallopeptidase n=1 Tax=Pseudoalteromonas shioyasakiensis TaxID=1190813 RepID=UPI002118F7EC|nr:SprT family zinc-dependent metalloprotease [Pseudoalteromonas shioyasakiensis]MCQ8877252.1 M48 family metallopeptidase [Pseudoalteromonas shioyasakiensis]
MLEYTLKRSRRRKTVAIKVQQQTLTVYAPYGVAKQYIEQWLATKQDWIAHQISKQSQQLDTRQRPLQSSQIQLFDTPLSVQFDIGKTSRWQFFSTQSPALLHISCSGRVKNIYAMYQTQLEDFMREQLEHYIEMRIQQYCSVMGEALPNNLKITTYKRRWGSCNQRRELTFNLLLASAPHWVIDYVVVHELAHMKYLNHSALFWQRVSEFYPDYKHATQWLKQHGGGLQWVFGYTV